MTLGAAFVASSAFAAETLFGDMVLGVTLAFVAVLVVETERSGTVQIVEEPTDE
jgi:hypothetical protein